MNANWHGHPISMDHAAFHKWRMWMLQHQPSLYFAWARALARQELERENHR